MSHSAYGISPLGEELGAFGGVALITTLGVLASRQNSAVVVFDRAPRVLDDQGLSSAINPDNYSISAVDPTVHTEDGGTFVPSGAVVPTRSPSVVRAEVDDLDPTQVHIYTDVALEGGVEYSVLVESSIEGLDGEAFAGPQTWSFYGRSAPGTVLDTRVYEERYRDLAMLTRPDKDGNAGYYLFDSNNDLGIQGAQESLRKRIIRRVFTQTNGFTFLPGYGVGLNLKTLIRQGELQRLATSIAEQAKKEPDVATASATVRTQQGRTGTVVIVTLFVQQRNLVTPSKFSLELPV